MKLILFDMYMMHYQKPLYIFPVYSDIDSDYDDDDLEGEATKPKKKKPAMRMYLTCGLPITHKNQIDLAHFLS